MTDGAVFVVDLGAGYFSAVGGFGCEGCGAAAGVAGFQVFEDSGEASGFDVGEGGHAALAVVDDLGDLGVGEAFLFVDERGEGGRIAFAVASVADGALALIDVGAEAAALFVFGEAAGPDDVVGVDVDDAGFDVDRGAAPLGAAVKAGEDDGLFVDGEGDKDAVADEGFELFGCPGVSFGGAGGEHVGGEELAGVGRGDGWDRLGEGGFFAGGGGGGEGVLCDGEERVAVGAVEEE